ncbi:MAG TPA: hypothetical protein VD814_01915 [Nocardioides sp.]|nr:hypothetical protein [Nocardioides sp.]
MWLLALLVLLVLVSVVVALGAWSGRRQPPSASSPGPPYFHRLSDPRDTPWGSSTGV